MTLALSLIVQNNTQWYILQCSIWYSNYNTQYDWINRLKIFGTKTTDNIKASLSYIDQWAHSYCHHTNLPQNSEATMCLQTRNRKRWNDFQKHFVLVLQVVVRHMNSIVWAQPWAVYCIAQISFISGLDVETSQLRSELLQIKFRRVSGCNHCSELSQCQRFSPATDKISHHKCLKYFNRPVSNGCIWCLSCWLKISLVGNQLQRRKSLWSPYTNSSHCPGHLLALMRLHSSWR